MPPALGFALFTLGAPLGLVNFVTIGFGATVLNALGAAALGIGASLVSSYLNKNSTPKAEDGKYNLKQNVPPLCRIYGRVKKGGDYVLLEEAGGFAYHIIVHAGHRVEAYVEHWLHDDLVTHDGAGIVTDPAHYYPYVGINDQLGYDVSTAYSQVVAAFPDIWTDDHRGDGLASIVMTCGSPSSEDLQTVYPNNMPVHTAVIDGALIYDPRDGVTRFSSNLALIRADHLRHPSGGAKLGMDDLYWPDWQTAANICDEWVTNREGGSVRRYHGGLWYRYSNDQVEVGRLIDQAAELVIYERPDGKIGVHAGHYVEPDIRLTANDIISHQFDANRRRASNVVAVRGRYTDPSQGFNTVDAAIYGIPYATDETERTRTFDNQVVQDHNHSARLQKITYIRANAPRVSFTAHYEAARNVPYRRFVRVHLPPTMVEAVVEITGRPKLSLVNLTYSFEGIVVPASLYDFDAATEEGVPGGSITPVAPGGTPVPTGFAVTIETAALSGGQQAAYALATWDHVSDILRYELTWQLTSGGAITSAVSASGEDEVRTSYLADGSEYEFRLRAWSPGGGKSDWTSYVIRTATADPTAPPVPAAVSSDDGAGSAVLHWTTPNSTNFASTLIYRNAVNDFATATLVDAIYSGPSLVRSYADAPAAGTYYYWLTSANFSGVESAAVATGATIVS
ncbi:hypothetical protein SAMN02745157_0705 [Kaistia soli DSM 19436]|uniref:Fibronectin type-III domain-containing protein n=1 Tax=Kaistia soli DSM 19436 TaxID=1122133 RepID=A0A1M4VHD2_9HYPH|nr:hypothetical protein [Kaistia soli]SHE68379.1 hypothetical protein SAMN02745157_0705 [Kaistia soli DSM 19436]